MRSKANPRFITSTRPQGMEKCCFSPRGQAKARWQSATMKNLGPVVLGGCWNAQIRTFVRKRQKLQFVVSRARLVRPVALLLCHSFSPFYEAGLADSRSIFQSEINPAVGSIPAPHFPHSSSFGSFIAAS